MSERTEEVWSYTQSERIDKDNQSESLAVVKHLFVHMQSKAACSDTEEEHEGYTKRYACYPDFA